MTSYTHNIAETRDILHKISNELVDSYLQNLQEKAEKNVQENQNILILTEQNKLQFQEIVEKDKRIVDYKKKCYDYEQIINKYPQPLDKNIHSFFDIKPFLMKNMPFERGESWLFNGSSLVKNGSISKKL